MITIMIILFAVCAVTLVYIILPMQIADNKNQSMRNILERLKQSEKVASSSKDDIAKMLNTVNVLSEHVQELRKYVEQLTTEIETYQELNKKLKQSGIGPAKPGVTTAEEGENSPSPASDEGSGSDDGLVSNTDGGKEGSQSNPSVN